MSDFDETWLALREPADRAARDGELVAMLASHCRRLTDCAVLDLGCGTGSTWRALNGALPEETRWTLVDQDRRLLDAAARLVEGREKVHFHRQDIRDLAQLPLAEGAVVTASALFDLCSDDYVAALVDRIASDGCMLYAALNFDGVIRWSIPHALDATVQADFNRHQQTDKGFGPALGPSATQSLSDHLSTAGYAVTIGASPWRMSGEQASLQRAFLEGLRQPLEEIGSLSSSQIEEWFAFRFDMIGAEGSVCEVGHSDLLATPPAA
ncbi:class I SAM-dependent methyltransferase [Pseudohoeflea suaedae]|uniref:Class I SAM-dependent methyltransferase n=1 Tax=Pseudohoeflea suaedae TaxID=877384 RepID=A0A4R5PI82_9HYPH|nr:class I SAM-dependent methyltransferase [Pseudohoeflea suaedae]TDH34927.1 class I SAM-dependent methyltransferase [Pseudohoeflea suaedae]